MSARIESMVAEEATWQMVHVFLIFLAIALFAISGSFIVSVMLMKLLLGMVNQMTDGELDRNEGVALLISAAVFAAASLLLVPYVTEAGVPWEQAVGWLMAGGAIWGLAVAYKVILHWWHEMEMTALPASSFTQTLKLPEQPYLPSGGATA